MLFLQTVDNKPIRIIQVNIHSKDYDYLHKVITTLNMLCPNCEIIFTSKTAVAKHYSNLETVDMTKEVKKRL